MRANQTSGERGQISRPKRRFHGSDEPTVLGQTIDQQILAVLTANASEKTVRARFLQIVQGPLGATSACFLVRTRHDCWLPREGSPKVGRLPQWESLPDEFIQQCDDFTRSPNVQQGTVAGQVAMFAPIRSASQTELFFMTPGHLPIGDCSRSLHKIAVALQLWLQSQVSKDDEWKIETLSSILELVGLLESKHSTQSAAVAFANELASHLGCDSVAVGVNRNRQIHLMALSGVEKVDRGSAAAKALQGVLIESTLRQEPGLFPAVDSENNHLLLAHRQLVAELRAASVYSFPLTTDDDEKVGAVVITGDSDLITSERLHRFCDVAGPAVARTLRIVDRSRISPVRKAARFAANAFGMKFVLTLLLVSGVVAVMFMPVTYRIRCNCVTEVVHRRFAVAPFAGQIVHSKVKAGDAVKAEQVLAELDGRTIRWELSGTIARREQADRTREIELVDRNVPRTMLAELEHDRLSAEEAVLRYKRDHLQVKSPIDGVILAGDIENSEAASVETGDVLFEVGPLKPIRIELAIPSDDIAQVRPGFPVKVWINGQEDKPLLGKVARIQPRSETRDARNVFVARVEFPNDDERLKPGMAGTARIDCEQRRLGWALFHKPVNWARARFSWW